MYIDIYIYVVFIDIEMMGGRGTQNVNNENDISNKKKDDSEFLFCVHLWANTRKICENTQRNAAKYKRENASTPPNRPLHFLFKHAHMNTPTSSFNMLISFRANIFGCGYVSFDL